MAQEDDSKEIERALQDYKELKMQLDTSDAYISKLIADRINEDIEKINSKHKYKLSKIDDTNIKITGDGDVYITIPDASNGTESLRNESVYADEIEDEEHFSKDFDELKKKYPTLANIDFPPEYYSK